MVFNTGAISINVFAIKDMLRELTAYYQKEGISALGFRCPFVVVCSKGYEKFTETREAFVGTEYEKGTLLRLLFFPLDPGSRHSDPTQRTAESVRLLWIRVWILFPHSKAREKLSNKTKQDVGQKNFRDNF
jgi:hypothetical protein